jgi:hypothetical protein
MKVQLAIPYRVTHSQRYEVTLRGNVTGLRYAVTLQVFVQPVTPYRVTCNVTRLRYAVTLQVCTHPYTE